MSDERDWQRGGEHDPESSDERTEAYRNWQRQQQQLRPWDRQQPWQQESAPEPVVDPWSRPARPQQGPDAGAGTRGIARNEDDFRPAYRRDQQPPGPPSPNQQPFQGSAPQPPRPGRPQPVPSPFQQQQPQPPYPGPPRPDGPAPSGRGRHGGTHDSQELPRLGSGPGAGQEPGRRGGPPSGEYGGPGGPGGPPTGSNLPRISDPSRRGPDGRGPDGRGPDMYGNEPPRPGPGRREDAGTETFRTNRPGVVPPSRSEAGRPGRGADGGRINRDIDLDEVDPRGRGRYGGPGGGSGHGRDTGGGNRGMLVVGATVGVVVLALVAYFATRPSGSSSTDTGTADATASQAPVPTQGPSSAAPSAAATGSAAPTASSSASAAPSSSTSAVAVNDAAVHVAVYNGSGINGRAAAIKSALVTDGFGLATVGGTATKTTDTKVYYPSNRADSAAAVAKALAIPSASLSESTTYSEVTVVIGTDWSTGNTYPAG